jgi:preprotein translocase subunit SecG
MIVQLGSLQHELAMGQAGGGETSMIMAEADAKFLKRILMALVAATLATGLMAGLATVKAERAAIAAEQSIE